MEANLNACDGETLVLPEQNSQESQSTPTNVSLIAPEPSDEQKIYLVNYLKTYPYLLSANPDTFFTNASNEDSWQELVNLLNSFGTSVKSAKGWKKYWAQMMSQSDIPLKRAETEGHNIDPEFLKKRKTISLPTAEQKDFLINFIMENQSVMYHRDHKKYDTQKRAKKWKELTEILNSMPGPKKSIDAWKASWNAIALRAKTAVAKGDTNYGERVAAVIAFIFPERSDIHKKNPKIVKPTTTSEEAQKEPSPEFVVLPDPVPVPVVPQEPVILPNKKSSPPKKEHHKPAGRKINFSEYKMEQEKLEIQKKLLAMEERQTMIEELRANALERMLKREETKINDSTQILMQTKRLEIAYRQAKEEEATLADIGRFVVMTESKSKLLLEVLTKVTDIVNNSR